LIKTNASVAELVSLGNDGKSEVINEKGDNDKDIKSATASCPVDAISYKEN